MGYINYRLNFKHIRDKKFMTVEIGHSRSFEVEAQTLGSTDS